VFHKENLSEEMCVAVIRGAQLSESSEPVPDTKGKREVCPDCGGRNLRRLSRTGFLQERVFPLFGYYPWECGVCRQMTLLRNRGNNTRKRD
jgi:hypothetical protein